MRDAGQVRRLSFRHDLAAMVAALGSQVHDPVRVPDHVQIVLDHQDRIAGLHEAIQDIQQPLNVGEVQARGRLVQDLKRPTGRALGQFA